MAVVHVELAAEPARAPLPRVARHVVETVGIRPERRDRARAVEAVGAGVVPRERALPDVHAMLAVGLELRAPRIRLPLEAAAGRELPLGLRRQPLVVRRRVGM